MGIEKLPAYHLKPGTVLREKYVLEKSLGEGGFGITYLAWDPYLEEYVAIKELFLAGFTQRTGNQVTINWQDPEEVSYYEKNRQRFLAEARTLALLSGQNQKGRDGIVQVREYFEENGTAYIVMEYLEGKSLKEIVEERKKPIFWSELTSWLPPVLEALSYIHKAGIYHRDLSPDNLMLTEAGSIKILDFGGAKNTHRKEITRLIAVKRGFTPPEQYQEDGDIGPWTDIYALCATLYYCLTAKIPPDPFARKKQKLSPPSALGISLPKSVERAILKGMQIPQKERWQSMEALTRALYPPKPRYPVSFPGLLLFLLSGAGLFCFLYPLQALRPRLPLFLSDHTESHIEASPEQTTREASESAAPSLKASSNKASEQAEKAEELPEKVKEEFKTKLQVHVGEAISLPDGFYRFLSSANPEKALALQYDEELSGTQVVLCHSDPSDPAQIFYISSTPHGDTFFQPEKNTDLYLSLDMKTLHVIASQNIEKASFYLQYEGLGTISIHSPSGWYWLLPDRLLYENTDNLPLAVSADSELPRWSDRTKWLCEEVIP